MVGAHHERNQQQGGEGRGRERFRCFSHALILQDKARAPEHAGDSGPAAHRCKVC